MVTDTTDSNGTAGAGDVSRRAGEIIMELQVVMQRAIRAEEAARKSATWLKFIKRHRDVADNDANYQMFLNAFGSSEQDQLAFELNGLEMLYGDPSFKSQLVLVTDETEAQTRAQLTDDILELLKKARSAEQLQAERARLKYTYIEDLKAQKARLAELKTLERNNTREQLHRASREHQRNQFAQPALPAHYTAQVLKGLKPEPLRKLMSYYGSAALTARLNGEN